MPSTRYPEHQGEFAALAYLLSGRLCKSCRNLHALWPYIRLSRSSTGLEQEGSNLERTVRTLIGDGLRRILVAGSADTGLLALVARAGADLGADVTVLDICGTPLELCRHLAAQWSMPLKTIEQDLLDLEVRSEFDLVLVHGTLHFIAKGERRTALMRIQNALSVNGRLVLLFNTSSRSTIDASDRFHIDYAKAVVDKLIRLGISLPDTESNFCERLAAHSRQRQVREGAFGEPSDANRLLEAAGFEILSCSPVDIADPARNFVSHISKRRFMTVAAPKHDGN
jgi:SAM-dependent methyltransferase